MFIGYPWNGNEMDLHLHEQFMLNSSIDYNQDLKDKGAVSKCI